MTLQPIITRLRKSCTKRSLRQAVGCWLLILISGTVLTVWAQSEIPESPQWTGQGGAPPARDADSLVPMNLELDLATDEAIPPPSAELEPQVKPPTEIPTDNTSLRNLGIQQPIIRQPMDATGVATPMNTDSDLISEADASMGMPDEENYYLPEFERLNWFQMDGLKFRIGPIHARITLQSSLEYNTNIFATSNDPTPDYVARIGPTFTFGTGGWRGEATNFARLTYTPSFVYYGENKERDTVNENLQFIADYTLFRYQTALAISYSRSNEPNATQQGLSEYSTLGLDWNNSYLLGGKTFLRANFGYLLQDYSNRDDYTTVTAAPQLAYEFSPKITVFAGPLVGIAYVGDGGTQPFQGINMGITYSNLSKLSGQFVFGLQSRQFEGENLANAKDFTTPVFNFSMNYELREMTSVGLVLSRDVQISDLERGLTYINNQLELRLRQQLFGRVDFNLGLAYQFIEYEGDGPDGRNDQYVAFTPSISYTFWKDQITWSIFYRRQQLTSDNSIRDYEINALGTGLVFQF